ncbi:MAG: flagellar hook assembly protein FlgD [Fidelibacterota bacterium]
MEGITNLNMNPGGAAASTQTARKSGIEMDEFLKLLLTELTNQDPTAPADSEAFAAQLAQFTSVEQLASIDSNIQYGVDMDLVLSQTINNTLAATAIGKSARADGNLITYGVDGQASLSFDLSGDASAVKISIMDDEGAVIRVIEESGMQRGEHTFTWDGKNNNGTTMPEGNYTFSIEAADPNGNSIQATPFVQGIINGVRYEDGSAVFLIGSQEIPFSSILEISFND